MRPREPRRPVLIKARMRSGAAWGDVSILNISSKGMLIQAPDAPPQGAYLEVRRGPHAIVARVIWTGDRRFGVCTQDRLSVETIVRDPDRSVASARQVQDGTEPVERRKDPDRGSFAQRHERSRTLGRTVEFVCIAVAGASAAAAAYGLVAESLTAPLAHVSAALTQE